MSHPTKRAAFDAHASGAPPASETSQAAPRPAAPNGRPVSSAQAQFYLAAIVESSSDAIVSKDLDGIVTSWNAAAERLFGYSAAEAIGRSIRLIIPADRQHEEDLLLARMRQGERVEQFETVRQRKDGSSLHVSLTVSPIRDDAGAIVGVSKIARDITARIAADASIARAEAEQRDLRQRLQALLAASAALLASPRPEDVVAAALRIGGELILADAYALWQFDARARVWRIVGHAGVSEAFASAMIATYNGAPAGPATFTAPLAAEDVLAEPILEGRRDMLAREGISSLLAVPLPPDDGLTTGSLTFYYRQPHRFGETEVETARALANLTGAALRTAELHEVRRTSEHQARFLAEIGHTAASSLDSQGTLRAITAQAVPHIADWCAVDVLDEHGAVRRLAVAHVDPRQVALAQAFVEKYPPDPASPYSSHQVIATGRAVLLSHLTDGMLQAGAESAQHLEDLRALGLRSVMIVPLRSRTSGVIGTLTFVAAESQRHYTEADLRFAESVASHVALAAENARAYERLDAANRMKDQFLAVLSHELRTPLNAILGYTHMLLTDVVAPERRQQTLERVQRNGRSLAAMVDELLDLSRIVTGKLRLDLAPADLGSVVDLALATVTPTAQAKGIRLELRQDVPHAVVQADAAWLPRVFWNLLVNAVKFTPRHGRVEIALRAVDGEQFEVSVRDTGQGIAPEFLPRIFEPFSQGDPTAVHVHGSLGLGLAIARRAVEAHGGTIHAASDGPGRGATFTVRLPAATGALAASAG